MAIHTDFKFHPMITQVGYYWGEDGHAEMYLLDGECLVLIDTGTAGAPEKYLVPALETAGRMMSDVGLILNTHGHYDHVSGNQVIVDASGAEVWLSEADQDIAQDFDLQFGRYFSHRDVLTSRPDRYAQAYQEIGSFTRSTHVSKYLVDGQRIELGNGIHLDVLSTPGHSPGSLVFYWEREGILFTGDSVVGAGSRVGGLPWIFFPDQYRRSLQKLLEVDVRILCLGHHYFTMTQTRSSVKYGKECRGFILDCIQVLDLLEEAVVDACQHSPDGTVQEIMRLATQTINKTLKITTDEQWGIPSRLGGAGLLSAILQKVKGDAHPG